MNHLVRHIDSHIPRVLGSVTEHFKLSRKDKRLLTDKAPTARLDLHIICSVGSFPAGAGPSG